MKSKEEIQLIIAEIREVCNQHGVVLIGSCMNEGIWGEITIYPNTSKDNTGLVFNEVYNFGGEYIVDAIGDLK